VNIKTRPRWQSKKDRLYFSSIFSFGATLKGIQVWGGNETLPIPESKRIFRFYQDGEVTWFKS
jgi:hypothetical protein